MASVPTVGTPRNARERASAGDAISFFAALVAGALVGCLMMAVVVPLVPLGLVAVWRFKRRRARDEATSV